MRLGGARSAEFGETLESRSIPVVALAIMIEPLRTSCIWIDSSRVVGSSVRLREGLRR
jgi:hypothetical protein